MLKETDFMFEECDARVCFHMKPEAIPILIKVMPVSVQIAR
jgi:hypothetical protein